MYKRQIIDLVTMKQHMYTNDNGTDIQVSEIDEQFKAKAEEMHLAMLEAVADYDDELMMKVLDGEEPSVEEVKAAIRKGVMTSEFFPVMCGSAYKNKGVQLLLDAVVDYLPAPTDIEAIKGTLEAVSYTHLDVYKRQKLHNAYNNIRFLKFD